MGQEAAFTKDITPKEASPKDVSPRDASFCSLSGLSVIIPTCNASQHIDATCESLLKQTDARWEAIFIDAGSEDRTLEIIRSYNDARFRIQSLFTKNTFEMLNRGIHMAQGGYVSFLFPGDIYLYPNALSLIVQKIVSYSEPDFFYTASYLYDELQQPNLIFRPLHKEVLRQGLEPSTLQACWIKTNLFKRLGLFSTAYSERGSLYYMCKMQRAKELSSAAEMRVFIETMPPRFTYKMLWNHFKETFRCIKKFFGMWQACAWIFQQKYTKRLLIRTWMAICHALRPR